MYRPIDYYIDLKDENKIKIFYKNGEEMLVSKEDAKKIIPIHTDRYYGNDEIKIIQTFEDGSQKTFVSRMEEI